MMKFFGPNKNLLLLLLAILLSVVFLLNFASIKNFVSKLERKIEYSKAIKTGLKFYSAENVSSFEVDSLLFLKKINEIEKGKVNFDFKKNKNNYEAEPFKRLLDKNNYDKDISFVSNIEEKQEKFLPENFEKIRNHSYYLATGDFYAINKRGDNTVSPYDDVMLRALYCDVAGYDDVDFSYLKALEKGDGGYMDTHLLFALVFLRENGCYRPDEIESEISKISSYVVAAENSDKNFSDIFSERIVFLFWSGKGDMVQKEWIDLIVKNLNQNPAGWKDYLNSDVSAHTTGLSLLSLLYYIEGEKYQPLF